MITKMVDTIIQAVSPLLGTNTGAASAAAGAAVAAAAGAATGAAASAGLASAAGAVTEAGAVCAVATEAVPNTPKPRLRPKAKVARNFFIFDSLSCSSKGFAAGFTGTDANHLFEVVHKDLAVADLAGAGTGFDGFDDALD